jgi:hypothetical protein
MSTKKVFALMGEKERKNEICTFSFDYFFQKNNSINTQQTAQVKKH